jgi:hypothetical protein
MLHAVALRENKLCALTLMKKSATARCRSKRRLDAKAPRWRHTARAATAFAL